MEEMHDTKYNGNTRKTIKGITKIIIILLIIVFSFNGGLYFSGKNEALKNFAVKEYEYTGSILDKYSMAPEGKLSQDVNFSLFWDVWDQLSKKYVDKDRVNEKKMFYGAIKGMVASVGDPYTIFMDPKVAEDFQNDLAGTFEGIGAEIGIKNDILTVVAPLPEMPAEKAGLKSGDYIMAIDDQNTVGLSVDEAVNRIRGPKGSKVKLTIVRGDEDPKDFEITRDKIVVKSVRTEMRDDGYFLIKVSNFNDDTAGLFNTAVREAIEKNPKGIILDLRNNPGGYLETAIDMASEWVEEGVVVTEQYGDGRKNEHLARGRARLKDFKTVVLVNQGSASASEIVSGALKDKEEATIVGMKTFGKGSVQTLEALPDGSSVKITVAKWLTPNGTSINDHGIEPDITVELTLEDYNTNKDPQQEAALRILAGEDVEKLKTEFSASSTDQK